MILKCLAIDDEPLALDIINDYISEIEFLELTAKCTSPIEALKILKEQHIDIIFLDIQMPKLTGFEFLESINKKPHIIITTAYENYGAESYNYDVEDYLLKPISFSRFLKAIDKVVSKYVIVENGESIGSTQQLRNYIFVNYNGAITKINIKDIIYIKGMSDYVIFKTAIKSYIVRKNMRSIEKYLSQNNFIRVHKSYIIPIDKITSISGNNIKIENENIPIGNFYKNALSFKLKDSSIL